MRFSHSVQPRTDLSSAKLTEAIATEAQRLGDISEATSFEEAELGRTNRRLSHYGTETESHVNLNINWARIQKQVEHGNALAGSMAQKIGAKEEVTQQIAASSQFVN